MDRSPPPMLAKRSSTGPPKLGPPKLGPPKLGPFTRQEQKSVGALGPPRLGAKSFIADVKAMHEPWTPTKRLPLGPPYHMPGQRLGMTPEDWKTSPLGKAWTVAQKRFKETRIDQIIYCKDATKASYKVMDFGKFLDDKQLRFVMYRIAVIQKHGSIGAPYECDD